MGRFDALCHPGRATSPRSFLDEAAQTGTSDLMLGGYSPEAWSQDAALAHPTVNLWRSCGLHPWAIGDDVDTPLRQLHKMIEAGGVSAIGEIGLDRSKGRNQRAQQRVAFAAQLRLSAAVGLPVLLHIVRAHGAAFALLDEVPPPGGVVHGFSGAPEVAAEYVRRGLFISFGGMLLRSEARRARASAASVPL
ncbi:MAG: TatD DNase family protein, partial [Myxococcota bacterium]